jgi:amidophosphoribosyltransferase
MSTVSELFAPRYLHGGELTPEVEAAMARALGADSLRYLSLAAIARSVDLPPEALCRACLNGDYPTPAGERLYQIALQDALQPAVVGNRRTYESQMPATACR